MPEVRVREKFEASADTVWAEIEDFGSTRAWFPSAKVVEIKGAGAGAVRRVDTGAVVVEERCESHDATARRFSYALLTEVPEISNYVATVEVESLPSGGSALTWSCSFDCASEAEPELHQRYEGIYRDHFIASVRKHLARIAPSG